jgi:outer membrane protein insertion porin family
VGLGYSSSSSLVGNLGYSDTNLLGRGETVKASAQISQISKQLEAGFTEPYFLDRPLTLGFDIYAVTTNFDQESYQSDSTAGTVSLGFPISEYSAVGLQYSYQIQNVTPYTNAPLEVALAAGRSYGSIFGWTYNYNNLDDPVKPTKGMTFSLSQQIAGFGGTLKYLQTQTAFTTYHAMFDDSLVGFLNLSAGYITGYDGAIVGIQNRFFKGSDSFRGFKLAGIGPRDLTQPIDQGALGGNVYALGTLGLRLPEFLPASTGMKFGLFTDFGTLGRLDGVIRTCSITSCIKDNLAFRATAGVSMKWTSPVGPIQIDVALPYIKTSYDRAQILHFGASAGF